MNTNKKLNTDRVVFTKKMKKDYTILIPMMANIHFELAKNVFTHYGYKAVLLETQGRRIAETGLKYVHNDMCYPAILVIGQFIDALNSGKYDINKTALMITQTGGGCRASNYIHLLRKALKRAGYEQVPVISLNLSGLEKNSGFKITIPMLRKFVASLLYGDLLMLLKNQTKPYEVNTQDTDKKVKNWIHNISIMISRGKGYSINQIRENCNQIISDFAKIPVDKNIKKIKVGIVGEIYVKYSALGNNNLEEFLYSQNCEVCVPGIMGFALFKVDNRLEDIKLYGGNPIKYYVITKLMNYLTKLEDIMINSIKQYKQFTPPASYQHTKSLVKGVIGYGNKMGEGWLLTGEMLELTHCDFKNIICTQPFGCLPNHICGKGMIRKITEIQPESNIVAIDYDPGATKVNQENRIKLMLALAKEKLEKEKSENILPTSELGNNREVAI